MFLKCFFFTKLKIAMTTVIEKLTEILGSSSSAFFGNGTLGALGNNTFSTVGLATTGISIAKSAAKAFAHPNPLVKVAYGLSCASYGVAFVGSSVCLVSRSNPMFSSATLGSGAFGFVAHAAGRGFAKYGDCSSLGTETLVDTCIDSVFDYFTG
jgi:hypothetical protein